MRNLGSNNKGERPMTKRQQGFTLVEIAIVLVIIGLLLGGILKGQEMITQAKIKNVIADFSGVSAAYHGYQDRYRAIPGDDPNADTRWTTAPAAIKGSGNGVVDGTYNNACPAVCVVGTPESCMWWDHLRRAGFVSGNGAREPRRSRPPTAASDSASPRTTTPSPACRAPAPAAVSLLRAPRRRTALPCTPNASSPSCASGLPRTWACSSSVTEYRRASASPSPSSSSPLPWNRPRSS